jgi:maleylpyruvate isomerase
VVVGQGGLREAAPMYPADAPSREAAIDAGAGRPAVELVDDLLTAHARLEQAWSAATDRTWVEGLGLRRAGPATLAQFVFLRWREVELHLRDLGPALVPADGGWDDLPPVYADLELADLGRGLAARLPDATTLVLAASGRPSVAYGAGPTRVVVEASPGRLVGWLTDRVADPAWPALTPWGY